MLGKKESAEKYYVIYGRKKMSRIGNKLIEIPSGVEIEISGSSVTVKGPLGSLNQDFNPDILISSENGTVKVSRPSDERHHRSLHGLTRSLIANMVEGGFTPLKSANELEKLGYKIVIFPGGLIRAFTFMAREYFASLKANGTNDPFRNRMLDFAELNKILETDKIIKMGSEYDSQNWKNKK